MLQKKTRKQEKISLWKLFSTFISIGTFTFGGGYAMVPLIIKDIVEKKKWVTEEEFIDLFSVAQSLPGVFAVNISMFIGHKLRGISGSIISSIGSTLPSFVIILVLAFFFESIKDLPIIDAIMHGIRPAIVAMIVIPVITIWKALKLHSSMIIIPIIVTVSVWYFGVSPIWLIVLSSIIGILHCYWKASHINKP